MTRMTCLCQSSRVPFSFWRDCWWRCRRCWSRRISYFAANSSLGTPLPYRVAVLWSALDGSLLLWLLVLGIYAVVVGRERRPRLVPDLTFGKDELLIAAHAPPPASRATANESVNLAISDRRRSGRIRRRRRSAQCSAFSVDLRFSAVWARGQYPRQDSNL